MRWLIPVVGVAGLILLFSSLYTVHETEQVVITKFGRPIGDPVTKAGLNFKMPFVNDVRRFEKRVLQWDGDPEQIVTMDKKYIFIDTMARWRIDDVRLFLESVQNELRAQTRLDDILDGAVRDVVSQSPLIEVIRSSNRAMELDLSDEEGAAGETEVMNIEVGRNELARRMLEQAAPQVKSLGIELIDVRIKRLIYVDRVLRDVYTRMITERDRIAKRFISEGAAEQARIQGQLDRELKEIQSEAFRQAEEIKGEADAEAARIYSDAYQADAEFYAFTKTLETYRTALSGGETTLLLSTGSELFRYLVELNVVLEEE